MKVKDQNAIRIHTNCVQVMSGGKGRPCIFRWGEKALGHSSCRDEVRVIFLDIDGVLNSYETMPKGERGGIIGIHAPLVRRLNVLTARTGATLVLSSSWRKDDAWRQIMKDAGIQGVFLGRTGSVSNGFRGEEVDQWLTHFGKNVYKYCILDDDRDFYPWQPRFHTSLFSGGLTDEIVERIAFHFED
jgi:hypothetical protein